MIGCTFILRDLTRYISPVSLAHPNRPLIGRAVKSHHQCRMQVCKASTMQSAAEREATNRVRGGRRRCLESATPTLQTLSQTGSDQAAMCRDRTRTGRLFVGGTAIGKSIEHHPRTGLRHGLWRSDWHGWRIHGITLRSSASYR